MGYSNPVVDDACKTDLRAGLNTQLMMTKEQEVIQTVNQELPVIPLFYYPAIYLVRPDLCGLKMIPAHAAHSGILQSGTAGMAARRNRSISVTMKGIAVNGKK